MLATRLVAASGAAVAAGAGGPPPSEGASVEQLLLRWLRGRDARRQRGVGARRLLLDAVDDGLEARQALGEDLGLSGQARRLLRLAHELLRLHEVLERSQDERVLLRRGERL